MAVFAVFGYVSSVIKQRTREILILPLSLRTVLLRKNPDINRSFQSYFTSQQCNPSSNKNMINLSILACSIYIRTLVLAVTYIPFTFFVTSLVCTC